MAAGLKVLAILLLCLYSVTPRVFAHAQEMAAAGVENTLEKVDDSVLGSVDDSEYRSILQSYDGKRIDIYSMLHI